MAPPAGAASASATVHRVVLFPVSLPEAQESAETVYPAVPAAFFAALAVITTLLVAPFKTADKTDQPLASAVAVKVDETEPGATVADAGADSTVVLLCEGHGHVPRNRRHKSDGTGGARTNRQSSRTACQRREYGGDD